MFRCDGKAVFFCWPPPSHVEAYEAQGWIVLGDSRDCQVDYRELKDLDIQEVYWSDVDKWPFKSWKRKR